MDLPNKGRTVTAPYEQAILAAHIHQFFQAPERSNARILIVRDVVSILNASTRQWTRREVRLWFTNNKINYIRDAVTAGMPPPPPPPSPSQSPMLFPYGYVPMCSASIPPAECSWALPPPSRSPRAPSGRPPLPHNGRPTAESEQPPPAFGSIQSLLVADSDRRK
jgi:hypothetical protein